MADVETPIYVDLTEGKELVINVVISGGYFGSLHVFTLGTNRLGVDVNGQKQAQTAIVARLRFDNDMAKVIRDALDQHLAALVPPSDVKAN